MRLFVKIVDLSYNINMKIVRYVFIVILGVFISFNFCACKNNNDSNVTLPQYEMLQSNVVCEDITSDIITDNKFGNFTPYDEDLQLKQFQKVEKLKQSNYTTDNMLIIQNPFLTNTTSLYVYFKTTTKCYAKYNIHIDNSGIEDFSKTLKNDGENNLTNIHEYQLIGLIPSTTNVITIFLYNEKNQIIEARYFSFECCDIWGEEEVQLGTEVKNSNEKLTDGLFTVYGNDGTYSWDFVFLYDNNGVLRSEMKISKFRTHSFLQVEDCLYYNISFTEFVKVDRLGYVEEFYDLAEYYVHHAYALNENKSKIIFLGSKPSQSDWQDLVVVLDLSTKKVETLIDFRVVFKDYYEYLKKNWAPSGNFDWFHANSFYIDENNCLTISTRETSSIIKVKDIYSKPTLDYIIGEKNFWKIDGEFNYSSYVLDLGIGGEFGDFCLQGGQHSIEKVNIDNSDSQYYITMFNNNNFLFQSRSDYKYEDYYNASNENTYSYFYKYYVDENTRKMKLVKFFNVPYSGFYSSADEYNGNIIINSGTPKIWGEYTSDGQLIKSFVLKDRENGKYKNTCTYKVIKETYKNFLFI